MRVPVGATPVQTFGAARTSYPATNRANVKSSVAIKQHAHAKKRVSMSLDSVRDHVGRTAHTPGKPDG